LSRVEVAARIGIGRIQMQVMKAGHTQSVRLSLPQESARGVDGRTLDFRVGGHRKQLLVVRRGQLPVTRLRSSLSCPGQRTKTIWYHAQRPFEFPQSLRGFVRL